VEDKIKQKSIFIFRFSESISDRTQVVDSQKFSTGNNAFTALFPAESFAGEQPAVARDPAAISFLKYKIAPFTIQLHFISLG
jgi:hypothetical protein